MTFDPKNHHKFNFQVPVIQVSFVRKEPKFQTTQPQTQPVDPARKDTTVQKRPPFLTRVKREHICQRKELQNAGSVRQGISVQTKP